MDIDDYLVESERIVTGAKAKKGMSAGTESGRGKLACTTNRVVYVEGKDVVDISLNAVNSVEYEAPTYPVKILYLGVALACTGFLGIVVPFESATGVGVSLIGIGAFTLMFGLYYRSSTLRLHTPNKSYEFSTQDDSIQDVAHALRGYEQQA